MRQLLPIEQRLAWLAGILDGEGYVSATVTSVNVTKQRKRGGARSVRVRERSLKFQVRIGNTDIRMIQEIGSIAQSLGIGYWSNRDPYALRCHPNAKPMYVIHFAGMGRVQRVLEAVLPWLVTKRPQADVVLAMILRRRGLAYRARPLDDGVMVADLGTLRSLNRRGIGHGDVVEPTLSEPSRVVLGSVGSPLEGVVGADREREMNPHPAMGTTSSGVL